MSKRKAKPKLKPGPRPKPEEELLTMIGGRVHKQTKTRVELACSARGWKVGQFVRHAVERALDQEPVAA